MYNGSYKHLENLKKAREKAKSIKVVCDICNESFAKAGIKNHRKFCSKEKKICPVCGKEFSTKSLTCSHACANTYFRSGESHPSWKESSYRSTCFTYHDKKCIVCGENKIVEVHHLDENKNNNSPSNLIPLCPTHHKYWHSRYKKEIEKIVMDYIGVWESGNLNPLEGLDGGSIPPTPTI